ncbi:hypothetical protein FGO68_gene5435 [Halteria grandinella]|uniref:Uncharacterized protein n=1 Tax=Halteria grandinella TaxID=5974 RepID=A0A8J8NG26_HALGN|nr:hypothetical protein FGO68_gene5435 [Halteria grandinella]
MHNQAIEADSYSRILFYLTYSLQNVLSTLLLNAQNIKHVEQTLGGDILRQMKGMIRDLARMDQQRQVKPLFSGACVDLYQRLKNTEGQKSNSRSRDIKGIQDMLTGESNDRQKASLPFEISPRQDHVQSMKRDQVFQNDMADDNDAILYVSSTPPSFAQFPPRSKSQIKSQRPAGLPYQTESYSKSIYGMPPESPRSQQRRENINKVYLSKKSKQASKPDRQQVPNLHLFQNQYLPSQERMQVNINIGQVRFREDPFSKRSNTMEDEDDEDLVPSQHANRRDTKTAQGIYKPKRQERQRNAHSQMAHSQGIKPKEPRSSFLEIPSPQASKAYQPRILDTSIRSNEFNNSSLYEHTFSTTTYQKPNFEELKRALFSRLPLNRAHKQDLKELNFLLPKEAQGCKTTKASHLKTVKQMTILEPVIQRNSQTILHSYLPRSTKQKQANKYKSPPKVSETRVMGVDMRQGCGSLIVDTVTKNEEYSSVRRRVITQMRERTKQGNNTDQVISTVKE